MRTPDWDLALLRLINQEWRNSFLDGLMPFISSGVLFFMLLAGLVAVFLCLRRFRISGRGLAAALIFCAAALLVNDALVDIVKREAGRARPAQALPLVHGYDRESAAWVQNPGDYRASGEEEADSFYSGHASGFMALSLALMLCFPPLRLWLWLLPLAVGYSRIYMGRHYPTDVLLGWLAGALVAVVLWLAWRKFGPRTFAWLREAGLEPLPRSAGRSG